MRLLIAISLATCTFAVDAAHLAPWNPCGTGGRINAVPVNIEERFAWSATGEFLSASNAVAAETFAYDACGRIASAETHVGTNAYSGAWLRDAGGLVTNISYGAGFSVAKEYDAAGRLVAVRDSLGHEWTFQWDGEGKPLGGTSPDGRAHSLSYDAAGRLAGWSVGSVAGRAIERDAAGRRVRDMVTVGTVSVPQAERRAQNVFDRAGRIVSATVEFGTNAPVAEAYFHDAGGAMTNATSGGEAVFSAAYNAFGQLVSLDAPAGTTGVSPVASGFAYDALGNRVRAGGRIWIPDHDDPLKRPLLECDGDGTPVRAYIWGAGRLLGFVDIGRAGSPLPADVLTIAHCDEQGSVIALSSSDGTVFHTAHYGPHGEDWGATGENPTPFAWLGGLGVMRMGTGTTGVSPVASSAFSMLYLTRHRLYAPSLRRFLSSDPVGLSGGLNLYAYANGNPLAYIDPLGLSPWIRISGFFKMIGGAVEAAVGYGFAAFTAETGIGIAAGVAVGLHGTDVTYAGYYEMVSGVPYDTLTSQGLQAIGLSRDDANGVDAGLSMGATMGIGAAVKSGQSTTILVGATAAEQEPTTALFHGGVLRGGKVSGKLYVTPVREHALQYANDRVDGIVYEFKVPTRALNQLEVEGSVIRGLDSLKGVGDPALQYEFSPYVSSILNSYMIK